MGSHKLSPSLHPQENGAEETGGGRARLVVRPLCLVCFPENLDAGPDQRLSWTAGALVSWGWALRGEGGGGLQPHTHWD